MTSSYHNSENKPETLLTTTSQPTGSITISHNPVDLDIGSITIDLSNYGAGQSMYTYSSLTASDTITITGSDIPFGHPSGLWRPPEPFVNAFPEWEDFQEMCKEYPGLEKVYEHMKAYYNMCKDDWESKKKGDAG